MRLTVLNSGSDGNCYFLKDNVGNILVLDCGVNIKTVKIALNFDITHIVGVLATHEHSDHFIAYSDFENMGLNVFAPHLKGNIRENRVFYPYLIQSFRLPHDETFSYGFLIRHAETKETLLYLTDFEYCPYVFKACKVNHFIVECNYQPQYVDLDKGNKSHKLCGHCSIDTLKRFLKVNETDYTKSVLLIHMGKDSTNPKECVEEIKNVLSGNVVVDYARRNTTYNF